MKKKKSSGIKLWLDVPPWFIIGAVAILAPIFLFMTLQSIDKHKELTTRLLVEKGEAIIRSFEAGTRTGASMQWGSFQLQKLLIELAEQPGIDYLVVTDEEGIILADSDPSLIGENYQTGLDLRNVTLKKIEWRQVINAAGADTFEVYRRLYPFDVGFGTACYLFVGLDMGPVVKAREQDVRNTVLIAATLLLIGFAGISSLFLVQGYRLVRTSLSRVKAFSDSLVRHMPIGLIALDREERIITFNQAAEAILNIRSTDVIGKPAETVLPESLKELLRNIGAEKGIIEKRMDCFVEKEAISLEVIAALLREDEGTVVGRVMLFRDMTEVLHLKREIDRSRRLASLGSLAAGIAHEIRNPLSSIKGFAVYFRERPSAGAEDVKTADIMIQEVERLNRVIGQLLEFSRPPDLKKEQTEIGSIILRSLKVIEGQARGKDIVLRTDLPADIPAVIIDADKIEQVLLNLYLNAVGAMESGGVLAVILRRDADRRIRIVISDTGAGIRTEDLARIFDPYFTTRTTGTGLGLAIVHKIIEAHDGEVFVESELGKGTTVSVLLPIAGKDDFSNER